MDLTPTLMIPREDPALPVRLDTFLGQVSLGKLHARADLLREPGGLAGEEALRAALAEAAHRPGATFITPGLLDKTLPGGRTVREERRRALRQAVGARFHAYPARFAVASQALPAGEVDPAVEGFLRKHRLETHLFFFPLQDGFAFDTFPQTWEGQWSGLSLLIPHDSDTPTWAGFHGVRGVRLVPWAEVRRDAAGHPLAFVGVGTHSFFEAPGVYPQEVEVHLTVGQALFDSDEIVGLTDKEALAALFLATAVACLIGGPLCILVGGVTGLAAFIAALRWLSELFEDDPPAGDGSNEFADAIPTADEVVRAETSLTDEDPFGELTHSLGETRVEYAERAEEESQAVRAEASRDLLEQPWYERGLFWGDLVDVPGRPLAPGKPMQPLWQDFAGKVAARELGGA